MFAGSAGMAGYHAEYQHFPVIFSRLMSDAMTSPHITFNPNGVPCIDGTRHRVIDIAADHVAHGYSAAQIVEQYPDLTPAQVHAALTYYYDHQAEL